MTPEFKTKTLVTISVLCLVVSATAAIALASGGNDFLNGELRVDQPAIYNAGDYRAQLSAGITPSSGVDYTTAWLGVDLAQYTGVTYSGLFSQVGLLTDSTGVHWFVYTEAGAYCLMGNQAWGTFGCEGNPGDLVSLGPWYRVEIINVGSGYWYFRVYDINGNFHDLAFTHVNNSTRIYRAYATEEEAYTVATDPYLPAAFYISHPQYLLTSGYWQEWPWSEGGHDNTIIAKDNYNNNTFCPQQYGANPNYAGDERAWYAGTNGQVCWWLLFPSSHVYLPLILNNS